MEWNSDHHPLFLIYFQSSIEIWDISFIFFFFFLLIMGGFIIHDIYFRLLIYRKIKFHFHFFFFLNEDSKEVSQIDKTLYILLGFVNVKQN